MTMRCSGRAAARFVVLASLALPAGLRAQAPAPAPAAAAPAPRPADVATPEALVQALYETVQRPPGGRYDWPRLRSLMLPGAMMIPNTEQTGGQGRVLSVEDFIAWIDRATAYGGPNDRGFAEEQIAYRIERYGDIAQVFSTYQKHFWNNTQILGRGINSIQLLWRENRWWLVSIVWDEENGAGPLPEKYLRNGEGR